MSQYMWSSWNNAWYIVNIMQMLADVGGDSCEAPDGICFSTGGIYTWYTAIFVSTTGFSAFLSGKEIKYEAL